jgi:benzoate-CoA ligase family protein
MAMTPTAIPERFNAASFFIDRHVAEGRGSRVAFHHEGGTLTYAALQELVNRAGNAFRELGVEREQRVLCLLLDTPEFLAAFWGALKIGAVPVPLNTMLRASDYLYFLNDSRASVLVVSEPLYAVVEPVLGEARFLRQVVVTGKAQGRALGFDALLAKASARLDAAETSRDEPAFWLYSSGSTGFPKGAVHLQHDMVVCLDTYARQVLGMTEADRTVSAAKLFFAYGMGNNMYFPMGVGGQGVLYPHRPLPEAMFELMHKTRPTIFFGIPTLYAAMLQVKDAASRYDLSSLRVCVSAGEALPEELFKRWGERFGVEILDGIGTTEILHIFLSNRPGRARPGSTGLPVPGYEARIVDDEGAAVPRGEIGNLRVKGDSTMAYYWNQHEKTKNTLHGHWINTGDKYYEDEDGFFWYCGRGDDMLKVGGVWVSPIEVENTLVSHPAVLEVAVVGQEDAERLVKPKAYVVLKEGAVPGAALEAEIKQFVKDKIAAYKYPRWVEFVTELPKTATGKIQRFKLRQ